MIKQPYLRDLVSLLMTVTDRDTIMGAAIVNGLVEARTDLGQVEAVLDMILSQGRDNKELMIKVIGRGAWYLVVDYKKPRQLIKP